MLLPEKGVQCRFNVAVGVSERVGRVGCGKAHADQLVHSGVVGDNDRCHPRAGIARWRDDRSERRKRRPAAGGSEGVNRA